MNDAIEYDIFVPLVASSGHRYADDLAAAIKADLIAYFGGLTDTHYSQEGSWKIGQAVMRDEIVIWRVLSTRGEAGDRFMQSIKRRLEQDLQQDLIMITRRQVQTFT